MADAPSQWAANPQYQSRIQYYRPLLAEAAARQGLPADAVPVMESILGVESRFGTARGLNTPGAAGELGILQQTPAFRRQYNVTNPMDDQQQIDAMARYFRDEYSRGAPLALIPAGYNAGSGRLRKLVAGRLSQDQLPSITQRYLNSVQAYIGGGARDGQQFAQQMTGRAPAVARTLQHYGLPTSRPVQTSDAALMGGLGMPQDAAMDQPTQVPAQQPAIQTGLFSNLAPATMVDIDSILGEYADARI